MPFAQMFVDAPCLALLIVYALYMVIYTFMYDMLQQRAVCRELQHRVNVLRSASADTLPQGAVTVGEWLSQNPGPRHARHWYDAVHATIQASIGVMLLALAVHGVWAYW